MPMKLRPTHEVLRTQRLLVLWFQLERTTLPCDAKAAALCGFLAVALARLPARLGWLLLDDFTALFNFALTCCRWPCDRLFQLEPFLAARAALFAAPVVARGTAADAWLPARLAEP